MKNPFSLSDDDLKTLLSSYSAWSQEHEKEKDYAKTQRQLSARLAKTLLDKDYLLSMSDDELFQAIFDYSRSLEGPAHIALGEPRIKAQKDNVKRNLLYIIESPEDPFKKAGLILKGRYQIAYFAKAFWTPIFQAQYPTLLPNWNNKTDKFFKKLKIDLTTSKLTVEENYRVLSDAFLYLQSLDPAQDFHTLNHLMHYGTVIEEGKELINRLLKGGQAVKPKQRDELTRKIERWRKEHVIENRIEIRKEYEAKARNLLETKGGEFNEEELRQFFAFLNTDFWKGKLYRTRFGMAYTGKNLKALVDQLEETNKWILRIWDVAEQELKALLDEFYEEKPLKNAGTAFPSVILYLRDPSSYNLNFKKMEQGLKALTGFSVAGYSGNSYFTYNTEVNKLKDRYALQPQEVDIILCLDDPGDGTEFPFSPKTFQLLEQLQKNPTRDFYQKHKEAFKKYLEGPFQQLFFDMVASLVPAIRNRMETEKGLFSRIIKNDFGKGGAWDYYWGATYPKGGKRISDAQLFVWINRHRLEFGFYIGEYGGDQRNRFIRNAQANHKTLYNVLNERLSGSDVKYGEHDEFIGGTKGIGVDWSGPSLQNWLKKPEEAGIHAAVILRKEEVLQRSAEELSKEISLTYEALFPLVLLAILDDPMPEIGKYIGEEAPIEPNPEYPLYEFAKNTGADEASLQRWVWAIERKGQVIIYGPPGTGKTYMAEHFARHLIGGGDGFFEVVQFHPAYAYEDFIQGIRPKTKGDGQLDYPLLPGRFLEFCEKAKGCTDLCVLIVDEINRANLARVFGELMYLLEYRHREVPLAGGGVFRIPENVRVIGTMNTADRSIALVDHALRRRFAFLSLYPNYEILRKFHENTGFNVEPLIDVLIKLNKQIGDRHYEVGISFFLKEDLSGQIEDIWRMEIEPYLEEYFFDQHDKTEAFRWEKVEKEIVS